MNDLFGYHPIDKMPDPHPGKTDTSAEAADKISLTVGTLRYAVYDAIAKSNGLTPSEIADKIGKRLLGVRPRTTELQKAGLIVDSGERRRNEYGNNEIVWRITH